MLKRTPLMLVIIVGLLLTAPSIVLGQTGSTTPVETGYADVNDLQMYYEIYGEGEPLVVLHGAYMSIRTMGELIPRLAETRQVIAVEMQGHGRTADVDRPFSYEQLADDVAALMGEIGIEQADVFGFSLGGGAALQLAIRYPEVVDRLVLASTAYNSNAYYPGFFEMVETITPDIFAGTPVIDDYVSLAPNPDGFPALVEKMVQLDREPISWPAEDVQAIAAPTLIISGDSDSVRPEHAVEMFRLRGGGVDGDLAGLPNTQLAVLPGTTHIGVIFRVDWLESMITEFLDAPMSETP
jgi:pimeloyl-ACP methyl ester carboxylesterase